MSSLDAKLDARERRSVELAVERVCASDEFHRSERLTRFLRFIVGESLNGNETRLKAYSIALSVFDRSDSFDPQLDPVVRIEAGRLRRALERYYTGAGADDPIIVSVPKGAYVPIITRRNAPDLKADFTAAHDEEEPGKPAVPPRVAAPPRSRLLRRMAAGAVVLAAAAAAYFAVAPPRLPFLSPEMGAPVIAVMPFVVAGGDERANQLARGVSEELIDQLASYSELRILGRETARSAQGGDVSALWKRFRVRYVVEGSVSTSSSGGILGARLVDAQRGQVLWSARYPIASTDDVVALQSDLSRKLADTIGRPYGIAFRVDAMQSPGQARNWDEYACIIQYYTYRAELSGDKKAGATECLKRVLARHPEYATAWAMLALVYMDDFRAGGGSGQERAAALVRFREAAARAYALAPDNLRAVQSLMLARFFESDVSSAVELGERALRINPNDTEVLGEYGVRLAQTGRIGEGRRMVERALEQNPGNASYYVAQLAIMEFMQGNYEGAERMLIQADLREWPLHYLTLAMVRSQMGKVAQAREDLARFTAIRPTFLNHLEAEMQARNFPSDTREKIRASIARLRTE